MSNYLNNYKKEEFDKNINLISKISEISKMKLKNIYLSIDLDVMSREEFKTPYPNQGELKFKIFINFIEEIKKNFNIIGIDICGLNPSLSLEEKNKLEILLKILMN